MNSNIAKIKSCYGCGVCAAVCPHRIIDIRLNSEGYYEARVMDADSCTGCGLCVSVCSYSHDGMAQRQSPKECYAAWSEDEEIRKSCSSGGVGYELVRTLLSEEYKVAGVRYDAETNRAVHYIADTEEKAKATMGSKYIQSYTVDAFRQIDRKQKYLVTGTPCQIDSFRRYIQKFRCEENFVLMDFFCHGVPSMNLWKKYSKDAEKTTGEIVEVSWRNKTNGWHDSWDMNIHGKKREEVVNWHDSYNLLIREKKTFISSRWSQGDLFFKMFLSNSCLGKACYEKCKFKGKASSADIRIGDLWGKTYEQDEKGVSGVVVYTERGLSVLKQTNCQLVSHPYEVVAEAQMGSHLKEPLTRGLVCRLLGMPVPLKLIFIFVQFTRLPYLIKCKIQKIRRR